MKSTNPNAGMGFTEDDEEDEEDMNMSRSSRTGGSWFGFGCTGCIQKAVQ